MSDVEKSAVVEDFSSVPNSATKQLQNEEEDIYIDPAKERKLLWKCDIYLTSLLTISFLSAYLDRSNIGNAAVAGMLSDLGMSSQDLANAILMFYVTYVPFELPGSLLVKKIRPSRLLPIFMLGWSLTCLGTGFMKTVPQFYASRLLIGVFESGMYPALAITLTTFYTPKEQGRRFAYLYLSVGMAGGFGGLFAYALLKLDGVRGIAGWRWLFIVEGILSVCIAIALCVGMPDSYENAKFLNNEDKELMRLRMIKHDRYMRLNESFDKREVFKAFKDKKLWLGASIQFFGDILSFGISTFLPSLVKSFKFDSVLTQLLTVPIYFWAVSVYIAVSFWSDRVQQRAVFMISGALAVVVGYAMLSSVSMELRGVLYFACFIIVPGVYCMLGLNYVWMLNSHAGYFKRATAIGVNMTVGNCAGLVIGQIFKNTTSEGRYLQGEVTSLAVALGCPNERRTITREDLGYYKSVAVGAVYDFGSKDIDLRSPRSYFWALKSCLDEHPFLNVTIRNQQTEKPFYERLDTIHLEDHIVIDRDLVLDDGLSSTETQSIELVLNSAVDRSWLSGRPPWRMLVHPILSSPSAKPSRCFIAFSFSHALGDALAGLAFHRTFLDATHLDDQIKEAPHSVKPSQKLPAAFDTPERLPISWRYLLGPLLAVLLPKVIADFLGIRSTTSTIDQGTWLGSPIFFKPDESQTRIRLLEIDNSLLQLALRVSRRNGTKLTATLHRVIIRALSRAIPASEATNFVSQTAINMRTSIGIPNDEIGLYVTGYYENYSRDDSSGPLSDAAWAAARSLTKELAQHAVNLSDQPVGLLRYAPSMRGYLTGKVGQKRDSSYEVSNLVTFSDTGGNAECKITKMVFASPSSVVSAPLVFNVVSVKGGSLIFAVTWQPGALGITKGDERGFVEGICESILSELRELE
ncbi:putative Major facilitator superfamily (MFS) profile domain-containing protein [Seiridium cardinale]|uniref:Major facilitator superfamily (MFS) profile domain-containing protein n=1 Tax=Seiridium cardinale TaxID=138064 RepID=A0ABR2XM95_9PEZI